MSNQVKSNVRILNSFAGLADDANKGKVNDIIDLYTTRKIVNFRKAMDVVYGLSSTNKSLKDKASQDHKTLKNKYKDAPPKPKGPKPKKPVPEGDRIISIDIVMYRDRVVLTADEEALVKAADKRKGDKYFKGLLQIHKGQHLLKIPESEVDTVIAFFRKFLRQLLTTCAVSLNRAPTEQEKYNFQTMKQYLRQYNEELEFGIDRWDMNICGF